MPTSTEVDEKYIWTLNSESTSHMTPNKEIMLDVKPYYTKIHLAENERSIQTEAKGNVKVTTLIKEGNKNICINDVLYVPSLRADLLSVSQLVKCENKVVFSPHGAKILTHRNEIIGEATQQDGMYIVHTTSRDENCQNTIREKRNQNINEDVRYSRNDKLLWHKRLGHICEEYLDTMQRESIVRDLNFSKEKLKIYEACIMGKIQQRHSTS